MSEYTKYLISDLCSLGFKHNLFETMANILKNTKYDQLFGFDQIIISKIHESIYLDCTICGYNTIERKDITIYPINIPIDILVSEECIETGKELFYIDNINLHIAEIIGCEIIERAKRNSREIPNNFKEITRYALFSKREYTIKLYIGNFEDSKKEFYVECMPTQNGYETFSFVPRKIKGNVYFFLM